MLFFREMNKHLRDVRDINFLVCLQIFFLFFKNDMENKWQNTAKLQQLQKNVYKFFFIIFLIFILFVHSVFILVLVILVL